MRFPPIIEPREVRRLAILLIVLVGIVGLVNVPWAVTMIRPHLEKHAIQSRLLKDDQLPRDWPSGTPAPWPPPSAWVERVVFGCRFIDVHSSDDGDFVMNLQRVGWPLPVLEYKSIYRTDGSSRKGSKIHTDPRPSLMPGGLLLNPLILGGGAWLAIALQWLFFTILRRTSRWRNRRCMKCGYPIGTSAMCTECGAPLALTQSIKA